MKSSSIFVFITVLFVFGLFAVAQENENTHSQPILHQQKTGVPGQRLKSGMKYTPQRMMDQDCSGCMVNRILRGSSNFYIDMRNSLGLTDTQVDMLQEIRLDYTKQTVDLQGELRIALLELQDMLDRNDIQINEADRKIRDAYDLEAEFQVEKFRSILEARNVLTPSQREQVKSLTRREMMMPNMGRGHMQSY